MYIPKVLMPMSFPMAVGVYALMTLLSSIACLLLPIETKGREMLDQK